MTDVIPQQIHLKPNSIAAATRVEQFSGPVPPPQILEQYDALVPGSAKQFLQEPHLEAEHRRAMDRERHKLASRGQTIAFIIAGLGIMGGSILVGMGHDISGIVTVISTTAISVAPVFLRSILKGK